MDGSLVIPYETMLNALSLQLALLDGSGNVVWANERWLNFEFGASVTQLPRVGRPFRDGWETRAQSGDLECRALIDGVTRFVAGKEDELYLEYSRTRRSEVRWFLVRGAIVDEAYTLVWHVDITTRKLAELHALDQANHDPLTRVRNRSSVFLRLETLIASSPGRFAIAIADIDDLKALNDSMGHQYGDRAIIKVARALERPGVEVGRIGGDEFLVLFPGVWPRMASSYVAQVNKALTAGQTAATVSLGFSYFPRDGRTAGELVGTADRRMYQSKARRKASLPKAA